ncbi:hypothetical protein, partial [Legionella maioricensis]
MAYTLTLLGTDTTFAATEGYDKAETLSYISTLIPEIPDYSEVAFPTDKVTQYRNSKIAVIDGPTTLGAEVGDRIARGVLAILEAISRGEKDINIIAHSRGAVEAILVAHELERIQTLLAKQPLDRKLLTQSVCKYTTDAMNGLHKESFAELDLEKVANSIDQIQLSMLTIDPVPGGNYMGITWASTLAWKDPRFYRVPKIVKEYEQYVYENERTRCFKPIVPKCDSPETTSFKLCSLPGHHGTGSGNLMSQQRQKVPDGKTAEHVQELVIVKIIDFLTRNGVTITSKKENDPFEALIAELMPIDATKLKNLYLKLYEKIRENKEAYQYFNTTSYPTLGQEQALLRKLWTIVDQRIVHYQAHNDTFLPTIIPPVPGGHFLNYEHARIHLNNVLSLKDDVPLDQTINKAIKRLLNICKRVDEKKSLEVNVKDMSSSLIMVSKVADTLDTKEGVDLLLEGLAMLIEEVRRPYLQDEFIDERHRTKVWEAVTSAFVLFNEFLKDEKHAQNEVAKTILKTLNTNLATTLETKHHTLVEQYQLLSSKLESNKLLIPLQYKIQELRTKLNESTTDEDDLELKKILDVFLEQAPQLAHSKSGEMRGFIDEHLKNLSVAQTQSVLGKSTLEWAKLLLGEALDDSLNYAGENMMKEVIKAHQQLEKFRAALPDFKQLYSELPYDKWAFELKEKRDHMVHLAARYIVREGLDLGDSLMEELFFDNAALYKEISGLAMGLGAKHPLEEMSFRLSIKLKTQKEEASKVLKDTIERLTRAQEDLGQELTKKLRSAEDSYGQEKEELGQQIASLQKKQEELRVTSEQKIKELE